MCVQQPSPDIWQCMQASIARGLAYAPYADMLWMETSTPSLDEAREFADAIHAKFPGKLARLHCRQVLCPINKRFQALAFVLVKILPVQDLHQMAFADWVIYFCAGKLLAYNCSPSFNWKRHLDDATIATFQQEIGKMGYKFQFVTLAGFHSLNHAMFELSAGYAKRGMAAYSELQQLEFASESKGYTCSKHQREV